MKNTVLIIKDNGVKPEILERVKDSYKDTKKVYYNTSEGSVDSAKLIRIRDEYSDSIKQALIMFVEYASEKEIRELYVGYVSQITEKASIQFVMYYHLDSKNNSIAINSILNKIDFNLELDYDFKEYILISHMDRFYKELYYRIFSKTEGKGHIDDSLNACINIEKPLRAFNDLEIESYRCEYQRDRERIVNCKAFRRLVDKAQIFSGKEGDHYRTRMTHTLEVNQISKAISKALGLDLDLTEAIALGHDIGHTPFGHQGERSLNDILTGKIDIGIVASKEIYDKRMFGGFKHNYQGIRILTELEERFAPYKGLNISVQVLDGILKHTELSEKIDINDFIPREYQGLIDVTRRSSLVLEGQVVAVADEIAQRGHDVDDAFSSGYLSMDEFLDYLKNDECRELLNIISKKIEESDSKKRLIINPERQKELSIVSCIVGYFIDATIDYSRNNIDSESKIGLDDRNLRLMDYLKRVIQKKIICNQKIARADYNANEIIKTLFRKYYDNPRLLPPGVLKRIFFETLACENERIAYNSVNICDCDVNIANEEISKWTVTDFTNADDKEEIFVKRKILLRAITDYISGMTDGFAIEEYKKLS